jgi:hypothetical protein
MEHSDELNAELLSLKGEVSYIAAFPGTFVSHTEEKARVTLEKFKMLGRPLALYRIEIIDIIAGDDPAPTPPKEARA